MEQDELVRNLDINFSLINYKSLGSSNSKLEYLDILFEFDPKFTSITNSKLGHSTFILIRTSEHPKRK